VIEEEDSGMEKVGVLGWGHLWAALLGCFGLRWQLLAHCFLWFFGIFLCTRKRLGNA
jgi:hypothetical protein